MFHVKHFHPTPTRHLQFKAAKVPAMLQV